MMLHCLRVSSATKILGLKTNLKIAITLETKA